MGVFTKLSQAQIKKILENYPDLPKTDFKFTGVGMGTVNTFYRIYFPAKKRAYFLKIDEIGNLSRLKNELAVFENLKKHEKKLGFKFTFPIKTKSKKLHLSFGKKFILLFDEIPGKSVYKGLSGAHLKQIGQMMAKLHKIPVAKNIKPHRFDLNGFQGVFDEINSKLKKRHPKIHQFIKLKLADLKSSRHKLPLVLIHADIFPENLFWQGKKLTALIDFEAAGLGEPLFDIGVAIHSLCHDGDDFDPKSVEALLDGYESVRPLSDREQELFADFMELTALRFLLTRLRDFELRGVSPKAENFKDYREYWVRVQALTK